MTEAIRWVLAAIAGAAIGLSAFAIGTASADPTQPSAPGPVTTSTPDELADMVMDVIQHGGPAGTDHHCCACAASLTGSVERERHGLQQGRARNLVGGVRGQGHQHHSVASAACAPSASRDTRTTTASVATTCGRAPSAAVRRRRQARPPRHRGGRDPAARVSARCSGTMRASGPAADSASRGPSTRTSVSTSPRRAGPASVAPTTALTIRLRAVGNRCRRAVFESDIGGGQFDPRARSRAATTMSVRSSCRVGAHCSDGGQNDQSAGGDPAGGQRCATSPAAARPASRLTTDGLRDSPMPPR